MKPIDRLGFGPKREAKEKGEGMLVTVTPPSITGLEGSSIWLTLEQYNRYRRWCDEGGLIQNALPELTKAQREILITGIGPEDFDKLKEED